MNITVQKMFYSWKKILIISIAVFTSTAIWNRIHSHRDLHHKHEHVKMVETTVYERNSHRIQRIEDFCQHEEKSEEGGLFLENAANWCRFNDCPIYHINVYNFSFCFMHKVASTTFQSHLVELVGFTGLSKAEVQWHGHRLRRLSPAHMMNAPFSGQFKFLFARHPFRRLVSAYYAKLVIECTDQTRPKRGPICPLGHRIKLAYRGEDDDKYDPVTFKELARYIIENNNPLEMDSHWTKMTDICDPCRVHYDFVGKIETADEDMQYVYNLLGLTNLLGDISEIKNKSGSEDKYLECFSQLTTEEFNKLVAVYQKDFDYFDYDPEEFRKYINGGQGDI